MDSGLNGIGQGQDINNAALIEEGVEQVKKEHVNSDYDAKEALSVSKNDSNKAGAARSFTPPKLAAPQKKSEAHLDFIKEFAPLSGLPESLGLEEEAANALFKKMLSTLNDGKLANQIGDGINVKSNREVLEKLTVDILKQSPGFDEKKLGDKIEKYYESMDEQYKDSIDNPSGLFKELMSGPKASAKDIVISKLLIDPNNASAKATLNGMSAGERAIITNELKMKWGFDVNDSKQIPYFDPANRANSNLDKKTSIAMQQLFKVLELTPKIVGITGPADLKADVENSFKTLQKLMSGGSKELWDSDAVALQLQLVTNKLQNNRIQFSKETIEMARLDQEANTAKSIEKLRDQIEKAKESEKTGCAKKAFGWIGFALMVIATVAVAVVSFGKALAPMAVALAIMLVVQIDSETGGHIMTNFAKALSNIADDPFGEIAAQVVILIIMIACAVASFGMGSGQAVGAAANTAVKTATLATKIATVTQKVVAGLGVATGIASGVTAVYHGNLTKDIEDSKAENLELKALMLRLNQLIEDSEDELKKCLEDLEGGFQAVISIMQSNQDTKSTLMKNLGKK